MKNAEDLTYILGNLKGPIMKIAQLASTVPDFFHLSTQKN